MQFGVILRRKPGARASGGPAETVGVRDHYSGMVLRLFRASGGMADALASGASVLRDVGVQVPLRPPKCDEVQISPAIGRGSLFDGAPVVSLGVDAVAAEDPAAPTGLRILD